MFGYIIIAIIAYLLGNISTSYIVAKRIANVDIRTQGSGNAGSTNVLRTLGKRAGVLTFVGDVLKGTIAVLISEFIATYFGINATYAGYIAVVAVIVGHIWPVFLGFRGGKGVATSLGSMLAVQPIYALLCFAIFIVIVAITKYVSLGSVVSIGLSPVIMLIVGKYDAVIPCAILGILIAYTHRENIKRLIKGTERKIGEKKQ